MNIVKPFSLSAGDYLELDDHSFVGPLVAVGDCFATDEVLGLWSKNGVPNASAPRIRTVIKGEAGIYGYIDRMSGSASAENVRRARIAIERLAREKYGPRNAAPMSVGSAAEGALQQMIRTIIREELRAVIREEMPAIVAENSDPFDGSEMRLAVTLSPMRS